MLNDTKKLIGQALYVVGYERDSTIRTRQFEIEKALSPLINGPSANTNLPDDFNPQAPRVTIGSDRVSANFSQITTQLTINVDNNNGKQLQVIVDSITKKIKLFQSCLDNVISREKQRERGIVLTVRYPLNPTKYSDESVFEYIHKKFLQVKPQGVPASVGFNVGYKTDDNFFFTLSVGQYKMYAGEIPAMQSVQWFDITTLPVVESGIELKIDVNSRPLVGDFNQHDDITQIILKKSFDFVLLEADSFMGVEK